MRNAFDTAADVIIEIRDLKVWFGNQIALKGINLVVKQGQIIGYIGPNGAGKSTTIKTMLGLVKEYHGSIRIMGHDIADSNGEYKRHIGYVPETAEIYESLTADEYLIFVGGLYGLSEKTAHAKGLALAKLMGLEDGYYARIGSYSKGMRQKVLLIAALLHNPEILFLDEPLSGLDANSVMIVKDLLAQLALAKKTIFYSSHIMDVVEKISSRIILLDDGAIKADGSFEELKTLAHEQSLEDIFGQMTGFFEHEDIAKQCVAIIQGD
ncbi:ABC transporter ATP-binding protein [Sulfobacillus thermosulfidooxidans]|uniref:ABC transporter ATP-binding protein n=1 Tax=Sulfobacillus thermosulfidooxidans TaxID=28034 RepID=UPI0006B4812B|nr:ABC transporter ATP-binding protein [Sulfobacillus thermosulfidooxidans]